MASEKATGDKFANANAVGALAAASPVVAVTYTEYKFIESHVGKKVEIGRAGGRAAGRNEVEVECAYIFDKVKPHAKERKQNAREQNRYDDLTLTPFSVGLAVLAQCTAAGRTTRPVGIKVFAFGSAYGALPPAFLNDVARIEPSPSTPAAMLTGWNT